MKRTILIEVVALSFVFLFAYAALSKLLDLEQFRILIGQSPLLTDFAKPVSWGIPTIELIICGLLVAPRFRFVGMLASFSLMVMFTAYIIAILQYGEHIPCSCGGVLSSMGWEEHLMFNIGFVVLASIGIVLSAPAKLSQDNSAYAQTHLVP